MHKNRNNKDIYLSIFIIFHIPIFLLWFKELPWNSVFLHLVLDDHGYSFALLKSYTMFPLILSNMWSLENTLENNLIIPW